MVQQYGVSVATVQRALNTLLDDGFIRAKSRAGTFVVDNPPHLSNFGLVLSAEGQWSQYYLSILEAAKMVGLEENAYLKAYFTSRQVGLRQGLVSLCGDISNHRLGGLIIATPTDNLHDTPVVQKKDMPRVLLCPSNENDIPIIKIDMNSFMDKAVEYFYSRGRRRIAHLCLDSLYRVDNEIDDTVQKRGIEYRPYWVQLVGSGPTFRGVASVVNLLMHLEGENRPDAMLIYDDNLVEHVVGSLMKFGFKVPDDLEIITMCNYPSPVSSPLPVKDLGLDCRMVLKKAVELIEMQRLGQEVPLVVKVPALFDEEVDL